MVMVTEDTEGFIRYEWADFDSSGVEDLSVVTVGLNHYINSKIKLTADVGFGLDAVNMGSSGVGWRSDAGDDDGQIAFRSQLQLLF